MGIEYITTDNETAQWKQPKQGVWPARGVRHKMTC